MLTRFHKDKKDKQLRKFSSCSYYKMPSSSIPQGPLSITFLGFPFPKSPGQFLSVLSSNITSNRKDHLTKNKFPTFVLPLLSNPPISINAGIPFFLAHQSQSPSVISEMHSSWNRVHNYLLNTQMKAEQDETKKMPVYLIISK